MNSEILQESFVWFCVAYNLVMFIYFKRAIDHKSRKHFTTFILLLVGYVVMAILAKIYGG